MPSFVKVVSDVEYSKLPSPNEARGSADAAAADDAAASPTAAAAEGKDENDASAAAGDEPAAGGGGREKDRTTDDGATSERAEAVVAVEKKGAKKTAATENGGNGKEEASKLKTAAVSSERKNGAEEDGATENSKWAELVAVEEVVGSSDELDKLAAIEGFIEGRGAGRAAAKEGQAEKPVESSPADAPAAAAKDARAKNPTGKKTSVEKGTGKPDDAASDGAGSRPTGEDEGVVADPSAGVDDPAEDEGKSEEGDREAAKDGEKDVGMAEDGGESESGGAEKASKKRKAVEIVELDDDSDNDDDNLDDLPLEKLREIMEREVPQQDQLPPVAHDPADPGKGAETMPEAHDAASLTNSKTHAAMPVAHDPASPSKRAKTQEPVVANPPKNKALEPTVVHAPAPQNVPTASSASVATEGGGGGGDDAARTNQSVDPTNNAENVAEKAGKGSDETTPTAVAAIVRAPGAAVAAAASAAKNGAKEGGKESDATASAEVPATTPAARNDRNDNLKASNEAAKKNNAPTLSAASAVRERRRAREARKLAEEQARKKAEEIAKAEERAKEEKRKRQRAKARKLAAEQELQNAQKRMSSPTICAPIQERKRTQERSTTSSRALEGDMVLPQYYTNALWKKLKHIAQEWSEQERRKGNKIYSWHIMGDLQLQTVARRVPTTTRGLSACGLPDETVKVYGRFILATVSEFLKVYQLQGYVDKAATAAGITAAAAAPAPAAPAAPAATSVGAAATGNNRNGNSVLPEGYTNMLKKKLKECVDKWAREEQMKGNAIAGTDIMTGATIVSVANSLPTSIEDLSDCGVSLRVLKGYGTRIVGSILQFVHSLNLEGYLTDGGGGGDKGLSGQSAGEGMVLPKGHTEDLRKSLADCILSWAAQERGTSGNSAVQWDTLNEESLRPLTMNMATTVPTTLVQVAETGFPKLFLGSIGVELLGHIKAFITARNLQGYVDNKASRHQRPSVIAAANVQANNKASWLRGPSVVAAANVQANRAAATAARPVQPAPAGRQVRGSREAGVSQNSNRRSDPSATANVNTSSQNQTSKNQPPAGERERWSEYRIDAAATPAELETIRRRLLKLVDRVGDRLRDKRLAESLDQMGGESDAAENLEKLTMPELMARLEEKVEKSVAVDEDGVDPGGKENFPSEIGRNANGKRSASEALADAETAPVTCPLCFEKLESPSAAGTCEICEEGDLCGECLAKCPCCGRSACADCLMGCTGCASGLHCSDCMAFGNGKCVACRPKKTSRTGRSAKASSSAMTRPNEPGRQYGTSLAPSSRHANQSVGYPPSAYPRPIPAQLPSFRQTYGYQATQMAYAPAPQQPYPSYPQPNHHLPPPAPAPSNYSYPRPATMQQQPSRHAPLKQYSIHRFIISQTGSIGLNIQLESESNRCLVSLVNKNSLAHNYGVELKDEILSPYSTGGDASKTYGLFLAAAKTHRPLMFEVKRHFPTSTTNPAAVHAGESLHRFIISEPGTLGMSLGKKLNGITFVTMVAPGSLAELYGIREDDVICKPCTNGFEKINIQGFFKDAISGVRPLVVEVARAVPTPVADSTMHMWQHSCPVDQNTFMFSFPPFPPPNPDSQSNAGGKGVAAGSASVEAEVAAQVEVEVAAKLATGQTAKSSAAEKEIILLDDSDDEVQEVSAGEEKKKDGN